MGNTACKNLHTEEGCIVVNRVNLIDSTDIISAPHSTSGICDQMTLKLHRLDYVAEVDLGI